MKMLRKLTLALTALLAFSAVCPAQVTAQLPATTLVALRVKNMDDFSSKVANLGTQLALNDQAPQLADVLAFACKQAKIDVKTIKKDGDFCVALLNAGGQGFNGPNPPMVMLIPTADYANFLTNYPDAKTDTGVSQVTLADGETAYVAKWGDYAAISPSKDIASLQPGGMTLTEAATKDLDSDACFVVNMPAVRAVILPMLMVSRPAVVAQFEQGMQQTPFAKYSTVLKAGINEALDAVQHVLADCDDVTYAVNLTPDGVNTGLTVDFKATSPIGQHIAAAPNTDAPMLAGLPDGKYLMFGGGIGDPKQTAELVNYFVDPLLPSIQSLGPDGQTIMDYIQAIKDIASSRKSGVFGMVVPQGELGATPLLQYIAITTGDAKTIGAASSKLMQLQVAQAKSAAAGPFPMQVTFTPAAKTVDGVQFDQLHAGFDMAGVQGQVPQLAQIAQAMSFVYGMDGLNTYSGVVNDTTYLQVAGLPDDKITAAVEAAKSGTDVLSQQPGVQSSLSHLPKQRGSEFFIPVDVIANAAFGYIAKFGMDMGVNMPASDPIALETSASGSAIHADSYIPIKLMVNISDAVKKLVGGKKPAAPAGAGGGGAGGGGL